MFLGCIKCHFDILFLFIIQHLLFIICLFSKEQQEQSNNIDIIGQLGGWINGLFLGCLLGIEPVRGTTCLYLCLCVYVSACRKYLLSETLEYVNLMADFYLFSQYLYKYVEFLLSPKGCTNILQHVWLSDRNINVVEQQQVNKINKSFYVEDVLYSWLCLLKKKT